MVIIDVLTRINVLSNMLQSKKETLWDAMQLVKTTIADFQGQSNEETLSNLWSQSVMFAEHHGIDVLELDALFLARGLGGRPKRSHVGVSRDAFHGHGTDHATEKHLVAMDSII